MEKLQLKGFVTNIIDEVIFSYIGRTYFAKITEYTLHERINLLLVMITMFMVCNFINNIMLNKKDEED